MELSIVIPVYNEQENIPPLIEALAVALKHTKYEVIFVDDGSTDSTVNTINQIAENQHLPYIKLIEFARNYGQTSAMAAGIEHASGKYIATLDGDLQNDPADIPMMIKKLEEENLDIVAGCRANRKDNLLRTIPSRIANHLIRKMTKVYIRDYGCTLKLFKSGYAKNLGLYGELHRFIPILGSLHGARINEVDVTHHPRLYGTSKYGMGRTLRVISDLLLMFFFTKYHQRPMHLFGSLGMTAFAGGLFISLYLLLEKIAGNDIANRPIFYIGILLFIVSFQFITTGFLAELLMRTYYSAKAEQPYTIRRTYKGGKEERKK